MKAKTTLYVRRSKDSNYSTFIELWEEQRPPEAMGGPPEDAAGRFLYAAYEVGLDTEVDLTTGEYTFTGVDGKPLIDADRLKALEDSQRKLDALEAAGVDNWEGYDEAMRDYHGDSE